MYVTCTDWIIKVLYGGNYQERGRRWHKKKLFRLMIIIEKVEVKNQKIDRQVKKWILFLVKGPTQQTV